MWKKEPRFWGVGEESVVNEKELEEMTEEGKSE